MYRSRRALATHYCNHSYCRRVIIERDCAGKCLQWYEFAVSQTNVTDVRFEPVEPGFEPEPNLFEPLLAVRFSWVRMGSVWGSTPGIL